MDFEGLSRALVDTDCDVMTDEPLAAHTTFRIGGRAALYVLPRTTTALVAAVRLLVRCGVRYRVFGALSNVLCSDAGFCGVILSTRNLTAARVEGHQIIADCGAPMARLAALAASAGLAGLAELSGIPGTLGGAVCMNAGAFGRELCDVFTSCEVYNPAKDQTETRTADALAFAYRHTNLGSAGEILLCATLTLKPDNVMAIANTMREVRERRLASQPHGASAGSIFRRPALHLSAGALIADAGLAGLTMGRAQISTKHAGFIVNLGGASAADVLALIRETRTRVFAATGYTLTCEVEYLRADDTACTS